MNWIKISESKPTAMQLIIVFGRDTINPDGYFIKGFYSDAGMFYSEEHDEFLDDEEVESFTYYAYIPEKV